MGGVIYIFKIIWSLDRKVTGKKAVLVMMLFDNLLSCQKMLFCENKQSSKVFKYIRPL